MAGDRIDPAVRVLYDPEADALAIDLVNNPKSRIKTRRLNPDLRLDIDETGRLVGIEVLNASHHYPRKRLEQLPTGVEWLTLAEAAEESGLSTSTLRIQINKGRLPGTKRGRDWLVAGHELWNYLESRAPQGRRSASERGARGGRRPRVPRAGARL